MKPNAAIAAHTFTIFLKRDQPLGIDYGELSVSVNDLYKYNEFFIPCGKLVMMIGTEIS
jgi:hypothetical protein